MGREETINEASESDDCSIKSGMERRKKRMIIMIMEAGRKVMLDKEENDEDRKE